ncbi:MAG: hypothetical protein IT182_17305 [Acidobacteria bacterium]|nr:hypothetical protein [Acidobacteriota bacterium]
MKLAVTVADAVVARLAGGTYSQSFTPVRRHLPVVTLDSLASLTVSVVPKSVAIEKGTRAKDLHTIVVDVAVQKKVNVDDATTIDGLMQVVEEIVNRLKFQPLAGSVADAMPAEIANAPIYDPKHMEEWRVFTSLVTVTYRLLR